jgi:quercetin dioxygenase-like cupin family protein
MDDLVVHRFAPGVYMREVFMPKGTFVIGHQHKTKHLNIITKGRALVAMNGEVHEVVAPCTIVSEPGVRKVLLIGEDMLWATIHPTNETNILKLEQELITKSEAYKEYYADIEQIKRKALEV